MTKQSRLNQATTTVRSRAPLRLGLAGGGTDVSPYCDIYGGAVLNATIDRYAYTVIKTRRDGIVEFVATDREEKYSCGVENSHPIPLEGSLILHKGVYNFMIKNFNSGNPLSISMTTSCDAPLGSGLGSSSTLVVSMIAGFVDLLGLRLDSYEIADIAYKIEREDCGLQGGHQDQYSAAFGGLNFMEFSANHSVIVNPLRVKSEVRFELEAALVLFFTGISRDSAKIIHDQTRNIKENARSAVDSMHKLKIEAVNMKNAILKADFQEVVTSMKMGWESKKKSAKSVTNEYLDEIYDAAINAGALSGKISGAGGGGFMLFYVPLEKRNDVLRVLKKFDGEISNCHFVDEGVRSWRVR